MIGLSRSRFIYVSSSGCCTNCHSTFPVLSFINEWTCYCLYMFVMCASLRCSSLFSVAVEQELHPEEVESEVCRSRLQLFRLAGGASRTDLRGSVILLTYSELSMTLARGAKTDTVDLGTVHWGFSWWINELQESGKSSYAGGGNALKSTEELVNEINQINSTCYK